MTLIIEKPTGAKLNLRKTWQPMDPDAAAYITAVEAADTAAGESGGLEERTKIAIDNFVLGCKEDGIWSAIKASCILAGARTLTGALVPLVGTAPTNVGGLFVSGDYNRKTGLVGDGSSKALNSNRSGTADPQNSKHLAAYVHTLPTVGKVIFEQDRSGAGTASFIYNDITRLTGTATSFYVLTANFVGISRAAAGSYNRRNGNASVSISHVSGASLVGNYSLFSNGTYTGDFSNHRLSFYSIGESLDLALLDARVTDLINAFAAAIP
jgi:hypothetical protein